MPRRLSLITSAATGFRVQGLAEVSGRNCMFKIIRCDILQDRSRDVCQTPAMKSRIANPVLMPAASGLKGWLTLIPA